MADSIFPPLNFPTAFADGVTSIANSASIVKFYLFRFDPSYAGDGQSNNQQVAQIIMPIEGFASMCAFFDNALQGYISQGLITPERYKELVKSTLGDK